MVKVALVGLAGAFGALLRYGVASTMSSASFPWATLLINVAGSLALGLVLGASRWSVTTTTAVTIGFLGSFTTFSTFSFEAAALIRDDQAIRAIIYVAASMMAGIAAAAGGWRLAR